MSKIAKYSIAILLVLALAIPTGISIVKANKIPTFDIVSVVPDEVVTIQTYDFPAGMTFDVLIGKFGSYGLTGVKIAEQNSEKGGTFTATYKIPEEFKGYTLLSIRLEDRESGYYAYNWFENRELPAATPSKPETGTSSNSTTPVPVVEMKHPGFVISKVNADKDISIVGSGFPENEEFDVVMGVYGTMGIGGEKVSTQKTGDKGEFKAIYNIPEDLRGAYMIAVRLESTESDYYAFNYFFNVTYTPQETTAADSTTVTVDKTTPTLSTSDAVTSPTVETEYQGYPYFTISEVKKDALVKIDAENLPVDEVFDVYLNGFVYGNADGIKVGVLNAGKTGKASGSFEIPKELGGVNHVSIRMVGQKTGYYAYNYFFNKDYPVVETPTPAATTSAETTTTVTPDSTSTEAAPAATPEAAKTPTAN